MKLNLITYYIVTLLCIVTSIKATKVTHCKGVQTPEPTQVTIDCCKDSACKLKKKSIVNLSFNFTPSTQLQNLTANVTALMAGLNVPFIGVTGTSANENIFNENGLTPAVFPLKAHQNYMYKKSFPILPFYPLTHLTITWALSSADGNVVCFQVEASIVK